ncbi:hypothetical protein FNV43_RR00380 [Rhamnella rubrinervis]|uniref:Uncharacterized protein n=1 Tax=Rhamnella rubrinervis TaxID=2594499 RepID=A0A8K0MRY6_9ROSA|nr:hypothetical protein FNV43_RR00380 [Rhamnella rubrinervis]
MEGFESGSGVHDARNLQDLKQFGDNSSGAVFDASQYAFFGKDVLEVELGGLEEEEEDFAAAGFEEEEFLYGREEGEDLRSLSDVDNLASTFSKEASKNPLYLGLIFVVFLLGQAILVQLDISGEFRNGAVLIFLVVGQSHWPQKFKMASRKPYRC